MKFTYIGDQGNKDVRLAGSTANSAYLHANAAYAAANSSTDSWARDQANAAYQQANISSGGTTSGSIYYTTRTFTSNGNITTFSISSNTTPNSILVFDNGITQNPIVDYNVSGNTLTFVTSPASGSLIQIRELVTTVPVVTDNSNAAFDKANSAYVLAAGAFEQANNSTDTWVRTQANSAFDAANISSTYANAAFIQANAAFNAANSATDSWVRTQANNAYDTANSAGVFANGAFVTANAAYTRANNSVNANTGGTITGDITITGNLIVSGANVALGNVGNVHIYGGNTGQILVTNTNGNLSFIDLPTTNTTTYTASTLTLTNGVYVSGSVTDTQVLNDGNSYQITDGSNTGPAWIITTTFTGVTAFNRLVTNIDYTASSGHTIYFQLYNNTTSTWDNIGSYSGATGYSQYALEVLGYSSYISGGTVQARLYHSNTGNVSHATKLDYIALELSAQGAQGPRGATGATGSTGAGVATGGTAGQILIKNSSTNYDTAWSNNLIDAWDTANSGSIFANGAFVQANTAVTNALAGSTFANSAYLHANAAYAAANAGASGTDSWARSQANAAFTTANNALPLTGGTVTGNVFVGGMLTVTGTYSNGITFSDGTVQYTANASSNSSTSAYAQANAASVIANSSYIQANSAFAASNIVGTYANTAITNALAASTFANSAYLQANAAYAAANSATDSWVRTQANNAYNTANSAGVFANGAFVQANSAFDASNVVGTYANSSFVTSNAAFAQANAAFAAANTATGAATDTWARAQANAAFAAANTATSGTIDTWARSQANASYGQANTATTNAGAASLFANSAYLHANAAYAAANTGGSGTDTYARTTANNAYIQANAAFTKANTGSSIGKSIAMSIVFGG